MANLWVKSDGSQLTINELLAGMVRTTTRMAQLMDSMVAGARRSRGVITEVCDVCAQPTDSEACQSHCRK